MPTTICFVHYGTKDEEAKIRWNALLRKLEHHYEGYRVLSYSLSEETAEDLDRKLNSGSDERILFSALQMEDGRTYQKLLSQISRRTGAEATEPLLSSEEALQKTYFYFRDKKGQTLLVLHGRHHREDPAAVALNRLLPNTIRVISMEGTPSVEEMGKDWKKKEVEVYPLMIAGGVHTREDILGEKEDSLFSKLRKAGFVPNLAPEHFSESKLLEDLIALALEKKL